MEEEVGWGEEGVGWWWRAVRGWRLLAFFLAFDSSSFIFIVDAFGVPLD